MWCLRRGRFRPEFALVFFFLISAILASTLSCTKLESVLRLKVPPVSQSAKPKKSLVFRSKDYIVCRLEKRESASDLAARFLGDPEKSWVIEEANKGVPLTPHNWVVIPLRDEKKGGVKPEGYQVVPILCYHEFAQNCQSSLCTPVSLFKKHMHYLKENGYRVIPMKQLLEFLQYRRAIPPKAVVITIDDGYRSAFTTAFPILKKQGFPATLFLYTGFIASSANALTWEQVRTMKRAGFEIGSHTLSHCNLTAKRKGENEQAYVERIKRELILSKKVLDEKLDQNTIYLAFPYGHYNPRVVSLCEKAGYKMCFSVGKGGNPFFADPLTLGRSQVLQKDMKSFVSMLKTFQAFSQR
ncbi:MAG: hypothetical protein DRH11_01620 [Deltaproteobacteria bacterium]|nr:MAG: hypothetical protein DRH11_01620 [Deltaproteobacteria bacterium]